MTQYLIAIHRPHDYDPVIEEDAAMATEIDALNNQMQKLGIIKFVGGLKQPEFARSITIQANGEIKIGEGLYLKAAEHVGGFWVIETISMDEALSWGQRAAIACRATVEVRPFY